jgi:hypothetical protein
MQSGWQLAPVAAFGCADPIIGVIRTIVDSRADAELEVLAAQAVLNERRRESFRRSVLRISWWFKKIDHRVRRRRNSRWSMRRRIEADEDLWARCQAPMAPHQNSKIGRWVRRRRNSQRPMRRRFKAALTTPLRAGGRFVVELSFACEPPGVGSINRPFRRVIGLVLKSTAGCGGGGFPAVEAEEASLGVHRFFGGCPCSKIGRWVRRRRNSQRPMRRRLLWAVTESLLAVFGVEPLF